MKHVSATAARRTRCTSRAIVSVPNNPPPLTRGRLTVRCPPPTRGGRRGGMHRPWRPAADWHGHARSVYHPSLPRLPRPGLCPPPPPWQPPWHPWEPPAPQGATPRPVPRQHRAQRWPGMRRWSPLLIAVSLRCRPPSLGWGRGPGRGSAPGDGGAQRQLTPRPSVWEGSGMTWGDRERNGVGRAWRVPTWGACSARSESAPPTLASGTRSSMPKSVRCSWASDSSPAATMSITRRRCRDLGRCASGRWQWWGCPCRSQPGSLCLTETLTETPCLTETQAPCRSPPQPPPGATAPPPPASPPREPCNPSPGEGT